MNQFQRSKDGRWYYGGYVTVAEEEYPVLEEMSKFYKVPDRIMAGILIRVILRQVMEGTEYDLSFYVEHYKRQMENRREIIKPEEKSGE